MATKLIPGYEKLLKTCLSLHKNAYLKAMKEILDFYWNLGNEVVRFLGDDRSTFGEATMKRLGEDLGIGRTNIYNAISLNTKFKKTELPKRMSWTQVRALLPLEKGTAVALARKADEKGLATKAINVEILRIKEKKYADKPLKFASTRITSILNPLSGIPDVEELRGLKIKEIDEPHFKKLELKLASAEAKLQALKKFIGKLKVIPVEKKKAVRKKGKKKQ